VARHQFLAEHFARFLRDAGVDATPVVGLEAADVCVPQLRPDVVVCDYELLMPLPAHPPYATLYLAPLFAMSMTRTAGEMHQVAGNIPVAYWYLPTLAPADAAHQLYAVAAESARRLLDDVSTFSQITSETR